MVSARLPWLPTVGLEDRRCAPDPKSTAICLNRHGTVDVGYVEKATTQILSELEDYWAKATYILRT